MMEGGKVKEGGKREVISEGRRKRFLSLDLEKEVERKKERDGERRVRWNDAWNEEKCGKNGKGRK